MPVITKVGIDPVHFGVVMTLNLMIGLLHPPLGMVLFVLARISKLSIERTTMAILPWLIPLLASLIAITLIPELTLWLPRRPGSSSSEAGCRAGLLRRRARDGFLRFGLGEAALGHQPREQALVRHQLAEGAALDDAAAVEHQDRGRRRRRSTGGGR